MMFETILITGCGGDIAQALARIARESGAAKQLIGCDTHSDHAGAAFFDVCAVVPRANDDSYFPALRQMIATHGVNLIVPASEAEIGRMHAAGFHESFEGNAVLTANPLAVETGLDKYATFKRLAAARLGVPWTRIVGETMPATYPCILKQRRGQGGKGLRLVETEAKALHFSQTRIGDIWQELLLPDDQEYTCGLYRTNAGETRSIVLRRRLQGGLTAAALVVDPAPFEALLEGVANTLELKGAINVQLRLTADGPKIFEINPRFSSTVGFRHKLGFCDFMWSLIELQGKALDQYRPPLPGARMYRVSDEIIVR
jgi:carbamoyl-phosphate synthase large subunit